MKLLKGLASAVMFVFIVAVFSLVILEFLAGCGAMYTDSEGVRHTRECLFINTGGSDG